MPTNKIVAKMMLNGKKIPKYLSLLVGYWWATLIPFHFTKHTHSSFSLSPSLPHWYTLFTTMSIIFFRQDHWKLFWNHYAPSYLLFEVKFLIFLVGFFFFFFNLSFNNDTHVIYELWKWYSCVYIYIYGFCVGEIIWWVGL